MDCHSPKHISHHGAQKLALVGTPNVGKSVIFNLLTGAYVTVSNYPGTTVDVSHGTGKINGVTYEVVDTPGMYSLMPITDEERVTRDMLFTERPDLLLHVVDAKNLQRMLSLTIQLAEAGLPVVLAVNMMDEAQRLGIDIDTKLLADRLGIPLAATAAARKQGMGTLRQMLTDYQPRAASPVVVTYEDYLEQALKRIEAMLTTDYVLSRRALALLLLQQDEELSDMVCKRQPELAGQIGQVIEDLRQHYNQPLSLVIAVQRQQWIDKLLDGVIKQTVTHRHSLADTLSFFTMWPVTGVPILLLVLYFGLYRFVGGFGAKTLVDYIENDIFAAYINPFVNSFVMGYIPWPWLQTLIGGDYGIITLGMRYAIAIVLPIVGTFFIAFSILEDSGYLPRLAMLVDKLFKIIGLNGRAVIPITLGFGCDTMAVMVSRTLETKRERIIATMLLSLAIPCSAQLGVVLGLLSANPQGLLIWAGFILLIFLFIGYLTAKLMPGERPGFYMEIPPLRLPNINNVLTKAYTRMYWYFLEILPLFILASVLIWAGKLTGVFDWLVAVLQPAMHLLGLPPQAAEAFLYGFFRRDYGAAGLYDIQQTGALNGTQLVVSAATLTLFVPCIAQFAMTVKERGWKMAVAMSLFIFPFAFFAGWVLKVVLDSLKVMM